MNELDSMERCVEVLVQIRDAHGSQLDARMLEELDLVIDQLKKQIGSPASCGTGDLIPRALDVVGKIIDIVTNLRDLMS